jgi:hypothetical protein
MYRKRSYPILVVYALFALVNWFLGQSNGQDLLEAKLARAKLTNALTGTATVYDGDDYIYILGG